MICLYSERTKYTVYHCVKCIYSAKHTIYQCVKCRQDARNMYSLSIFTECKQHLQFISVSMCARLNKNIQFINVCRLPETHPIY